MSTVGMSTAWPSQVLTVRVRSGSGVTLTLPFGREWRPSVAAAFRLGRVRHWGLTPGLGELEPGPLQGESLVAREKIIEGKKREA